MNFLPSPGYGLSHVGHVDTCRSVGLLGLHGRTPKMKPGTGVCGAAPDLTRQVCEMESDEVPARVYGKGVLRRSRSCAQPISRGQGLHQRQTQLAIKGPRHYPSQCDTQIAQNAASYPHDSGRPRRTANHRRDGQSRALAARKR